MGKLTGFLNFAFKVSKITNPSNSGPMTLKNLFRSPSPIQIQCMKLKTSTECLSMSLNRLGRS